MYNYFIRQHEEIMAERTNEQWVADLAVDARGRAEALEDLRMRLGRGLMYYLSRERSDLTGSSTDELQHMVEDFTQDALIKILDNLGSFRGESQFTTWTAKIAARIAISELRRARWRDSSLDELSADGDTMPAATSSETSSTPGPQPESYTERQDIMTLVDEAIQTVLTDRQREALMAHAVDGLGMEDIAQRMGTNRNALYKLIHDARLKLKKHLEAQGISMDDLSGLFETA
jgi:RNA polymerase sigma-70 factor (ECF subfamily)